MHEDLCLDPQHLHKNASVPLCTCNLALEVGHSQTPSNCCPSNLAKMTSFTLVREPASKKL